MSYALALSNPGSDIDKYLSQVYQIPVLTREEELVLTTEFFETANEMNIAIITSDVWPWPIVFSSTSEPIK